ncbi:potassium uptake TrkH family protein [Naumannella cuiyingiana]|uniref:Potassium uptake TrkH family protein n=1 Tax=Naumannella cuiyingiana TaxID=1347891 RepID=A0A7Z0D9N4_9ACTN|nr:potassium transporter TrkG [Naumannella cuiyingiana]NYI71367.1 potassium uptake TrkH family protein [Naumannella cuiyingiana]
MRRAVHPTRVVPAAFAVVIAIGTLLLALPVSSRGRDTSLLDAAFTAVSAVCVTGLTVLDNELHWSTFGQVVILALIQVGGFGIMTLATLLSLFVIGRLNLQTTLITRTESHTNDIADVRKVPIRIAAIMFGIEAVVAIILTLRFRIAYTDDWGSALWQGIYLAISSFNNAGFAPYSDNLMGFVDDGWITLPLCASVILGGIGFPVLFELGRRIPVRHWSIHVRITVGGTLLLLAAGIASFAWFEWSNPGTLGPLSTAGKIIGSISGGVMPRTAGFNSVDYGALDQETYAIQYVLMFIGGGSAGTAGGIKITTFFLLAFVIWSELRGEQETVIGHRRIGPATQRQALTVALLGVAAVVLGTLIILNNGDHPLQAVAFESISAFATVGLSTGITPSLDPIGKITLMVLMFIGRVGTITVGSAIALNDRHRYYRVPEERPIVG